MGLAVHLGQDKDIQRDATGSVKHAISLAKTILECVEQTALEYINAVGDGPENQEVMTFHANLLLFQISALSEVQSYHRAFPWRLVECLDPASWATVLPAMKDLWYFVINMADCLKPNDKLYWIVQVTRFQPFRDVMIAGEFIDFDVQRMGSPASRPLQENILAICGLQEAGAPTSLLSSLPSELAFNKLRDAAKRHSKQERCQPAALHSVAWKASVSHVCGCESLELTEEDWAVPMKASQIKVSVHSNMRSSCSDMGISVEGLTRHKQANQYTKPHIWTARLEYLEVLSNAFKAAEGTIEDKRVAVTKMHQLSWLCKVLPCMWFLKPKTEEADIPHESLIIVKAGPFTARCVKLSTLGDNWYRLQSSDPLHEVIVTDLDQVTLAQATPDIHAGALAWAKTGPWLSIVDFVCDHGIENVGAQLLISLCALLKIPGHSKLDHKHRVELFLKTCGRSEEYVARVLENLPEPRKRTAKESEVPKCFQLPICFKLYILNFLWVVRSLELDLCIFLLFLAGGRDGRR
ncbi:unnamed protein product [Durusdinium trenchii]|uniref:Uncharacterized protein n=1 Tax=Durusdinium trenchii TaxID=1381693 RepID=A0ABP0NHT3_9DINO